MAKVYGGKKFSVFLIDGGYQLVHFLVMGANSRRVALSFTGTRGQPRRYNHS